MITDSKRLQQILKNLLSNAFKFTEHGGVRLTISEVAAGWTSDHPALRHAPSVVAFEVSDTGVGIPSEKQKIIFEAFQQADASTSRKYGGTGLGLAISRELANLLGGEIQLRSVPGQGSTFTLYLPLKYVGPTGEQRATPAKSGNGYLALTGRRTVDLPTEQLPDDRADIQPGDKTLLIVEDDPHYARIIVDLARDSGLQGAGCASRRRGPGPGARVPADAPSRSTSSCPTCSAGRPQPTEAGSQRRAISRCRSSRSTRTASMVWRAGLSAS